MFSRLFAEIRLWEFLWIWYDNGRCARHFPALFGLRRRGAKGLCKKMMDAKVRTLITLAELGSYTKTAAALSLTQPAVSHQVRQLEREFGVKIFKSEHKKLHLTPEGEVLVKYARRLENVYHGAVQAVEDMQKNIRHLTVGLTPTVGENTLPQVLALYCNEHPDTHINIQIDTIHHIYKRFQGYELDLAIIDGNLPGENAISSLLDTDYLCLITAPGHRFALQGGIGLSELKSERLILRSSKAGTRMLFENYLLAHDEVIRNFNVILEIDNIPTIKELVGMDLGVSVIAYSACREEVQRGKLAVVPIENFSMAREINMVHHRDFAHREILEELRNIYSRIR